ncbi:MAG: DUF3794 domain-containing protein [Clostridiales bacterium]|nr:DUF3794 domain-containing protein [Clostridiales bacterium]
MELELDRTQLNGYTALLDTTIFQEETLEMIVPDACPDILRVVDTGGKVLLRGREAMDGRAEVSGTIRASVLYVPDGENGIRHLDVVIPFTCAAEGSGIGPGCTVVACARFRRADTRAVNPRKVLVRAEAAVDLTVFSPIRENICCQVLEAEANHVEQLTEKQEVCITACVQEKPFTISEEITFSAGKPAAEELLRSRVALVCGESKLIGNKLIFKGNANVTVLYRGEDNGIYTAGGELPFSQIMEISGVGEGADCALSLALTSCDCQLSPVGDGRIVSLNLDVLSQAVVRESRTLEVLADAYSTREPLTAQWDTYPMEVCLDAGVRSQNAREAWDTGTHVRDVTDCCLSVSQVTRSREGDRLILTAQVEVMVLYLGEDGGCYSAQRQISVPCSLEEPESCRCFSRCEPAGDVYATPAGGGLELRFVLDFHYWIMAGRQVTAVSALEPGQAAEEAGEQPSLVLRMLDRGERLWDVAKRYGTTIADIISANELADESAAVGKLLLIPRKR